jgi:hypothetical protein
MGVEEPPDDVAEQSIPVVTDGDDDELNESWPTELPWEADPADVVEQQRTVPVDDPEPSR